MLPIISGGHSAYQDTFISEFRCPKSIRKHGCFCETPCSDAKYGRTVHTYLKDDPRMFNIPPRDSNEWKKEYDRRTSVEPSNKREKNDDAWAMPVIVDF